MSKERNIDDAELANISGAGDKDLQDAGSGGGGGFDGIPPDDGKPPAGGGGGGGNPGGVDGDADTGGDQDMGSV